MLESILFSHNVFNVEVEAVSDGITVLSKVIEDQIQGNKIKLIICDDNMEYINGTVVSLILNDLANSNKIRDLPFLICSTGANDTENVDRLTESGFDLVIEKNTKKSLLENILKDLGII